MIDLTKYVTSVELAVPEATVHGWSITMQERDLEPEHGWRVREPTGMAWGECSCGLTVRGPAWEPLPKDEVVARLEAHIEQVNAP